MDNQHELIKGYRDLTREEIAAMNKVKELGEAADALLNDLNNNASYDRRWLAIARTDMQTGLMAAVRAIARPTTF